jgi:hypothetical protein
VPRTDSVVVLSGRVASPGDPDETGMGLGTGGGAGGRAAF